MEERFASLIRRGVGFLVESTLHFKGKLHWIPLLFLMGVLSISLAACSEDPVSQSVDNESQSNLFAPAQLFSWTAQGLTVTFENLITNGNNYKWEFGDSQSSAEFSPVHTYAAAGTYQVKLTARTSTGKLSSSQTVAVGVIIDPPPPPPGGDVPGPNTTTPFPIDMGDVGASTPGTYKNLPLRLSDNGEPAVTAVNNVIGVVCIGMSNSSQECEYFISQFSPSVSGQVNPQVKMVNCAVGGNAIERWVDPAYDKSLWEKCINSKLGSQSGITADQVRVIYHKAANMFTGLVPGVDVAYPPYPDADADYFNFYTNLGLFADRVKTFFPNVQAVYTTSRSYGGFSQKQTRGEPLSYEEGHALNAWLSDNSNVDGVWHGWGPYLWAPDCQTNVENGSGVCYLREDYQSDGIHPSDGANEKISAMIHARFSEHAWYAN